MSESVEDLSNSTLTESCSDDQLWLLSDTVKESHGFIIAGGVLAVALLTFTLLVVGHCSSERSPMKEVIETATPRTRELLINFFSAVGLVAANLLLLGGIQISFQKTYITIMVTFGTFSLLLSVAGIFFFASKLGKNGDSKVAKTAAEFVNLDKDATDMDVLVASDRYQDFGNDMFGTVWLGLAQMILLGMYIYSVYQNLRGDLGSSQEEDDDNLCSGGRDIYGPFYALALFVQIGYVFGKDAVKERFRGRFFWAKAVRSCLDDKKFEWNARDSSAVKPLDLFLRGLLSIIVNDVGLILLILVLPLQLSVVTRVDKVAFAEHFQGFVLDAVATYYVVEVDDISEKAYAALRTSDLDEGQHHAKQLYETDDEECGSMPPNDDEDDTSIMSSSSCSSKDKTVECTEVAMV